MSDYIIALIPWFLFYDSDVRMRSLFGCGLRSVTVLPRKTVKYGMIQTVVLQLKKGFDGVTSFGMFKY
jgi:hypothetical protein